MITNQTTIYGLTNEHGQICYVGQTRQTVQQRFKAHLSYGHQFTVVGLAILSVEHWRANANKLERTWIEFFGRDNLFNKLRGGGVSRPLARTGCLLSLPIDRQLDRKIQRAVKQSGLSRADVVRQALRQYYGLLKPRAA